MPVRSMTGVGQVTLPLSLSETTASLDIELRSVNSRFFECLFKTSLNASLETVLQKRIAEGIGRGRVEVRIGLQASTPGSSADTHNPRLAQLVQELLEVQRFAQAKGLELGSVSALDLRKELRNEDRSAQSLSLQEALGKEFPDAKLVDEALHKGLDRAMLGLLKMRENEGARLEAQIRDETAGLLECLQEIRALAQSMVPELQARLEQRVHCLLEGPDGERVHEVGQARLAQELAVLMARGDVQEELIRIEAHLHQVSEILDETPTVGQGKRLNFMCQELGREWSTVGAKFGQAQGSALVIAAKTHIERIREQAQNVE